MNEYRFILHDYHAISEANISIDGITVIAGCNGCGKSTISKWLYAFVNYSNDFNDLVDERLLRTLNEEIRKMSRVIQNIFMEDHETIRQLKIIPSSIFKQEDFGYDDLVEIFRSKLDVFCSAVSRMTKDRDDVVTRKWLQKALGTVDNLFGDFIASYFDFSLDKANKAINEALKVKRECSYDDLLYFIRRGLDLYGDAPREIGFEENGMELIANARFRAPLGLRNAVYIDTPMALSKHSSADNAIWDRLMNALTYPLQDMPEGAVSLIMRLRRIMGGSVVVNRDELNRDAEIRYIRKEDSLNIPIDEAATGLKSFAYMMRLIENGYLDENSLLLIDEPEAHLHPQWIVEFARILVLLNKELGTKILIASHNPDMIAALQSISKAEGLEDMTKFYQACRDKSGLRYSYEYLGNNIEKIFGSFNVALERIKYYGG